MRYPRVWSRSHVPGRLLGIRVGRTTDAGRSRTRKRPMARIPRWRVERRGRTRLWCVRPGASGSPGGVIPGTFRRNPEHAPFGAPFPSFGEGKRERKTGEPPRPAKNRGRQRFRSTVVPRRRGIDAPRIFAKTNPMEKIIAISMASAGRAQQKGPVNNRDNPAAPRFAAVALYTAAPIRGHQPHALFAPIP